MNNLILEVTNQPKLFNNSIGLKHFANAFNIVHILNNFQMSSTIDILFNIRWVYYTFMQNYSTIFKTMQNYSTIIQNYSTIKQN